MTKVMLERELRSGACVAVFEKKNGELRPMTCTLNESLIPPVKVKSRRTKVPSFTAVSVYDLDKNEWRSFILDNLKFFARKRA